MKLNKNTILFVLSSIVVLGMFVGFGFLASGNKETSARIPKVSLNSIASDSVKKKFDQTVSRFDSSLQNVIANKDSSLKMDESNLLEYFKLKNEIAGLLKDSTNIEDLELAKKKIYVLEYKIEELKNRNSNIEADNKRLNALVASLLKTPAGSINNITQTNPNPKSGNIAKEIDQKSSSNGVFAANSISLSATQLANNRYIETSTAENVEKFNGSFTVKTNADVDNTEIIIVLQQPNGQVVKNSEWESGLFQTKEGIRKIYSLILRFDYNKGETKQCNFSLNANDLPKGTYTLQLYHKGLLIAKTTKTLS